MFSLDYKFHDQKAMEKAVAALSRFHQENPQMKDDMTVKQMICAVDEALYEGFSRGDKCRVGRGISTLFNQGMIVFLERGDNKGASRTYHIST